MKGKFDVYIIQVGTEFRVRPAVWSAKKKDTCSFKNTTPNRVTVKLDQAFVKQGDLTQKTLEPNRPQGNPVDDQWQVTLSDTCAGGAYQYHVDVEAPVTVPAVGESEPVIIIDP